jgi:hypothetical protein
MIGEVRVPQTRFAHEVQTFVWLLYSTLNSMQCHNAQNDSTLAQDKLKVIDSC